MASVNKVKLKAEATKFFEKGKYEKAIESYRMLVKADKRDDRSMIRIAECYRKLKKNKEAIAAYRQVATFYASAGFLIKAIAINKQILEIDPENKDVQAELNDLYEKRGIPSGGGGAAAPGRAAPAADAELAAAQAEVDAAINEADQEDAISEAEEIAAAAAAEEVVLDLDDEAPSMEHVAEEEVSLPDLGTPAAAAAPGGAVARNLPSIPLFSDLKPDEFAFVIDTCSVKKIAARTRVIEEGEMGHSMFVLVSGEVLVYRHDEAGNTIKITTLKEGSFFGEFALLSDSKRHASVGALTECDLLEITRDHLDQIVAKFPRVGEVMNEFYKKRILATLLLTSPLFQPLSIEDRKQLVTKFQMMTKKPSTDILKEGGPGDGLYLIKSGEVEIIIHDKEGNEVTITYLSEGSFFGEISLIQHKPCTATVRTTQDTILLKLPKEAFNEVIMTHPQVLELITEYVEERQRETTETRSSVNSLSDMGMV